MTTLESRTESNQTPTSEVSAPSAASSIVLVAQREITTRVRTKSFVISTAVLMLVIIVGLIVWKAFSGGGPDTERVGLVGGAGSPGLTTTVEQIGAASGTPIDVVELATAEEARTAVDNDDLDGVIVVEAPNRYVLLSKDGLSDAVAAALNASIEQVTLGSALNSAGVDPTTLPRASVSTTETDPTTDDAAQRIVIALVGSMLLITAIMMGGNMIAVGVVEEKTSRIVEILLATVKPLHLMWGKILGIGAVALGQIVLFGATALIAGAATGLLTIAGTAVGMFAAVLVWFLLGFLFFATLYAAAGALVSRQEELGSTITPLTLLSMAVMYAGIFGIQALDSTLVQVLTWVPPFSAVLMPIRIATGDTDPMQVAGSLALMVLACAVATWVAARIYQRSILNTGSKTSWMRALR